MTALSLSLCHVVLTCFCPSVVVAVVVKKKAEILFILCSLFILSIYIYSVIIIPHIISHMLIDMLFVGLSPGCCCCCVYETLWLFSCVLLIAIIVAASILPCHSRVVAKQHRAFNLHTQ